MARDLSLGPSVAPCPVETSTAHGDSFFKATVLPPRKALSCCIYAFAADLVYSLLPLYHRTSEIYIPHQIYLPSPFSRRTSFIKSNFIKSRFAPIVILSIFRRRLCRHFAFNGQGLHLRLNSLSLLWINNYSLRTLVFASTTAVIFDSNCLKSFGIFLVLNSNCQSFEGSHGRFVTKFHSITILANDFKQRPLTITFKNWILLSHEDVDCYKRDPEPLFCFSRKALPDYKTVVSHISASVLLRVDFLVPARTTALIFSSMSFRLLTVTILSSMDLFVEDFSTNRDLTCTKTLHTLCLKVLMESLSIYFIYLFVVLGNVHYALNFGIFESFSMYLELFE